MVSIHKIVVGVMSCSFVLCLGLSNLQAAEKISLDPCANRKGGEPNLVKCDDETQQGIETIKGEVLRVEGNNYFAERFDGKKVRLHVDPDTQMLELNDGTHVLSLRQLENEASERSSAKARLIGKLFNSDHSLFGENATMLVQIDPLPACLVHLVSLMHPH